MSMHDIAIVAAGLCLAAIPLAPKAHAQAQTHYGFGVAASPQDLASFFAIPASGSGLPPGSGTAAEGAKVYADNCSACHGNHLEGNPAKGIGGDKLIGGRATLATATPVKTVESYWPYATTLFDYVKRGRTIDYFLEQFPSVKREQVEQLLDDAKSKTLPKRVPA